MWGMQFHPGKCISLSVARSQKPFHTSYILIQSSANNLVFDVTATGRSFMNMRKSSGTKTDP
jgi:hypothetical protein